MYKHHKTTVIQIHLRNKNRRYYNQYMH
uniref:Uncharacterized protein n=1 Tax=Arundo donax TaxID=35708 RepID=A0A0A9CQE9_ARUDO